ncbi:MAG: hypothetical protein IT473_14015 [Lysobacter sp.]|nr:hypothetical protein [Lysobacter sp.]
MNIDNLTDDVLCAYLDDELSPEARIDLERRLLSEPGARVRLDRFRDNDARLRRAFALPNEGANDPLLRLLAGDTVAVASAPSAARPNVRWRRVAAPLALAMAATVAGLAIGLGMRDDAATDGESIDRDPRLSAALQSALDRQLSGRSEAGTRILFSFRRADGTACRQFETFAAVGGAEGVACRRAEGAWALVVWHQPIQTSEGYRTAGAGDSPIDAVVEQIDASGPLSSQEEANAIARKWR